MDFVKQGLRPSRPVNAAEFFKRPRPSEKEIPESETFDYIVVGAGPAGSVVVGKLAEANPNVSILLLEAGDAPVENSVKNPRLWLLEQQDPNYIWGYTTTCQEGLYGRRVPILRSRGLGGGTSLLMWMRGGKETYNEWVSTYNCEGWGWNDILPYFETLEKEIGVVTADSSVSNEWSEALLAAGKANAMHYTSFSEENGASHGVGYNALVLKDGKMQNLFDVFVKRKSFPNVTVRCNAFVTHVLMAQNGCTNTAYGVHYRPTSNPCGPFCAVRARREVILTAGVIATPLILMRSGIGNHKVLRECGIEPLLDLPGVGHGLTDDIAVGLTYTTERELPKEAEAFGLSSVIMSPQNNAVTITAHSNALPGVWIMPESWKPGFQLVAICHSPRSRGYVRLDPNNLEGAPIIEPNYLSEKKDVKQAVKALQQLRSIGQSESLKPWRPKEVRPGEKISNKEGLEAYVRGLTYGMMYPAGTCRMGSLVQGSIEKSLSPPVVDPSTLKVYGCERLRVMDSSVLPSNPHGFPGAAVLVVAMKGACMLLHDSKQFGLGL